VTKEMTADWHEVYLQERRRPGYVIENGRSIVKRNEGALRPPRGLRVLPVRKTQAGVRWSHISRS